ncbi:MAG: EamA family transporter [Chloroflexi bacterium]|nr:EamA family transporter [Chloroflexota bacterium]
MIGEISSLSSALIGTLSSIIFKSQAHHISATSFIAWRSLIGTIFFLALVPFVGGWEIFRSIPAQTWGILLLSTLLGQIIGDTLFYRSVATLGVARTMPIVNAFPLITTILAVTILHEPLGWTRILGVGMVVGGLTILSRSQSASGTVQRGQTLGRIDKIDAEGSILLPILIAFIWGFSVFMLKPILQNAHPVAVNVIRQPLTGIVLWSLALRRKLPMWPEKERGRFWPALIASSILGVGISSLLFLNGIALAGAARGGTLASVGPMFALLLSPMLLKEEVTKQGILGTIFTIAGVWFLI